MQEMSQTGDDSIFTGITANITDTSYNNVLFRALLDHSTGKLTACSAYMHIAKLAI